ncbi:hypothetical protein GQ44DRAFT_754166 [Phaeosphaeriaceae sp. PMI808]|nr:hypothetical protein GQ44DRAFT_754166 [Phaeosphaeriaceae sp. PMI808]
MATPPTEWAAATRNDVDGVGDDGRSDEAAPDGGYGWVCVAACFTVNCFTWGTAYGVYLSHYLAGDVFPEASTWDYAFVGGFKFSIAMLIAPFVTILTRRLGIHRVMIAGLVFESGVVHFPRRSYRCGIGCLYIPSLPILSQCAAGSGVGGAAFAWGTEAIIERFDIGWALRITGMIAFAANLAAVTVIRDRNSVIQPYQLGFDTKLLRRYDVVLLLAWAFISMLGYIATDVIGLLNVGTAVGRPVIGMFSDRWSRIDTAGVLTLLCGLSCFAFWLPATCSDSPYSLQSFVGLFWGFLDGPLCVEVAGIKNLQSLLSLSWVVVIIPVTGSGFIFQLRRVKSHQAQGNTL